MKFRDLFKEQDLIFIAEIGINHNGRIEDALSLVKAAASAGAHAVKIQTYNPELMYSVYGNSLLASGNEGAPDSSLVDFFRSLLLSRKDLERISGYSVENNVTFFSSPFDGESVDLLERLNVPLYKIASSELTNHGLLKKIASTKKPILLSTGMSGEGEIDSALTVLTRHGAPDIILLHCVSLYPLPPGYANLSRIISLRERFGLEVGFSDHSPDHHALELAVALGARIFEKHFRLPDPYTCPDSAVSLTPGQFRDMLKAAENALRMMGTGMIDYGLHEKDVAKSARRSLYAARLIPRGTVLSAADIDAKRPDAGIPAFLADEIIGRTVNTDIEKDFIIRWEYLE